MGQAISYLIAAIERENPWLQINNSPLVEVCRTADDQWVTYLAGPRSGTVEDTAARAAFAKNDICRDACPGVLVPDLHELHRQNSGLVTVLGVESNGAVVLKIGLRNMDTVQLCSEYFSHLNTVELRVGS